MSFLLIKFRNVIGRKFVTSPLKGRTWCVNLTLSVCGSRRKSNRNIMAPHCREGQVTSEQKEGDVGDTGPDLARSGGSGDLKILTLHSGTNSVTPVQK